MAIKALHKPSKQKTDHAELKVNQFISKGGSLATDDFRDESENDHRLTLRIPRFLMDKIDIKRKQRIGKISRNLWILELIDKETKK